MKRTIYYQNYYQMSISQIKSALYQSIEQGDERLLRLMYAMAAAYKIPVTEEVTDEDIEKVSPSDSWQPMTEDELIAEIKTADEDIESGNYTTLEDLEKEMEQW